MDCLADSQVIIWAATDDPKLSHGVLKLLHDPEVTIFVSAASVTEIAIKYTLGKLDLQMPIDLFWKTAFAINGVRELPITVRHARRLEDLPWHHRDPFDRLLIAQASVESIPLLTSDDTIRKYEIQTIW